MPRLGSSRVSEDRLGGRLVRRSSTYAATTTTDATRVNDVDRTATAFLPSDFPPSGLGNQRLGDERLGTHRLGGVEVQGITSSSSASLLFSRTGTSYSKPVASEATRLTSLLVMAESYVSSIQTDADESVPNWRVGARQVSTLVEEARTWQELNLSFRASEATTRDVLRPMDAESGKLSVVADADGGYTTIDRAGGSNTYTLRPPTARDPPRRGDDYLVKEYEEEMADQQGGIYRVTLRMVADEERNTTSSLSESASGSQWEFAFHTGTIATKRVHQEIQGAASKGKTGKQLTLTLTPEQVKVLEESASHLNAVRIREVPDGPNLAEDNTSNDRNTVTVTSPDPDVFASGDYRVSEWETSWRNEDFYRVALRLVRD